jgi:hypothetical protein
MKKFILFSLIGNKVWSIAEENIFFITKKINIFTYTLKDFFFIAEMKDETSKL